MVEAPTVEQVLVVYVDAVDFMATKGVLQEFVDHFPDPLRAAVCLRVSEWLGDNTDLANEMLRAGVDQTLEEVKAGWDPFGAREGVDEN